MKILVQLQAWVDMVVHDQDVYAHGRACTYFGTYEGFGNAFVEA